MEKRSDYRTQRGVVDPGTLSGILHQNNHGIVDPGIRSGILPSHEPTVVTKPTGTILDDFAMTTKSKPPEHAIESKSSVKPSITDDLHVTTHDNEKNGVSNLGTSLDIFEHHMVLVIWRVSLHHKFKK